MREHAAPGPGPASEADGSDGACGSEAQPPAEQRAKPGGARAADAAGGAVPNGAAGGPAAPDLALPAGRLEALDLAPRSQAGVGGAPLRVKTQSLAGAGREPLTADSSFYSPASSMAGSPFARAPSLHLKLMLCSIRSWNGARPAWFPGSESRSLSVF